MQVFESAAMHEHKHLADTQSTGSPTLNSIISASGESHEEVSPAHTESLPKLQCQADRLAIPTPVTTGTADEDLVCLANRVDVGHAADKLAV